MINTILAKYPLPSYDIGNREAFIANLQLIHSFVIASESLLECVLQQELSEELHSYYTEHLAEERNHVVMLELDLQALNAAPKINWNAAQIVGTQYYLIKHVSPVALLGYMAALECRPSPLADVDILNSLYGDSMRFISHHAQHDIVHGQELTALIDTMPDDVIYQNLEWTLNALQQTLLLELGALNGSIRPD